ncbi:MAG: Na+/H+ antiporter NhaC family protein, partial [Planctomycetota bacterium]
MEDGSLYGWLSVLPPLVAIVAALLLRRVVVPLVMGIVFGAFLLAWPTTVDSATGVKSLQAVSSFSIPQWGFDAVSVFYEELLASIGDADHVQVLLFSLLLGGMVGAIESSGAIGRVVRLLAARMKSASSMQTLVAAMGLAVFFDDYANTILVGRTMRPASDRMGISRAKLAYLVDSTTAPVAGLALVSTWVATEISYMADGIRDAGSDASAFSVFLESIPYRFYAIFALAMVFAVAILGRDFGPMLAAERNPDIGDAGDPN